MHSNQNPGRNKIAKQTHPPNTTTDNVAANPIQVAPHSLLAATTGMVGVVGETEGDDDLNDVGAFDGRIEGKRVVGAWVTVGTCVGECVVGLNVTPRWVGIKVGDDVRNVGDEVGANEGNATGDCDGLALGKFVTTIAVGNKLGVLVTGIDVGLRVEGRIVVGKVGRAEGVYVGRFDGLIVVGLNDGSKDGRSVGFDVVGRVGRAEGKSVGARVGNLDGILVGRRVGNVLGVPERRSVGVLDGNLVGPRLVGLKVNRPVGLALGRCDVGNNVIGRMVEGCLEGDPLLGDELTGLNVVGVCVGILLGLEEGDKVGFIVGVREEINVGRAVPTLGVKVSAAVGIDEGFAVGSNDGACEGINDGACEGIKDEGVPVGSDASVG